MTEPNIVLPRAAGAVISRLYANGFEAFAVGGCVRDSIMGRIPNDWDVTTSARPEETLAFFRDEPFRAVPTGIAHGTITVVYSGEPIEVTTYRVDGEYSDCRHPDSVSFTSRLSDDLGRRDFTVNAMAYSDASGIVDPFDGRGDIERRLIRCVGEPEKRFSEDALRILRALRFASVLGFEIEEKTARAAEKLSPLLDHVSRERVASELSKLIRGVSAAEVIRNFSRVISRVIPVGSEEIETASGIIGKLRGESLPLLLSALLYGKDAFSLLKGLRFDNRTISRVVSILSRDGADDYVGAKKLCAAVGSDVARDIQKLSAAMGRISPESVGFIDEIGRHVECVSIKQLKIGGGEIMNLGIEPKRIGAVLESLLSGVIEGKIPNEYERFGVAATRL